MSDEHDPWLKTDDDSIDEIVDSGNVILLQKLVYRLKDERDAARFPKSPFTVTSFHRGS